MSDLRARVATGRPILLPGVHDALSAKLAERAGFEALFVSGFGLSASLLGEPDFGFVGPTEVLDAADRIVRATRVPVVVDVDTGYGGPFHVERLVQGLAARGASGIFLEDQEWPKRCGHMEEKRIVPLDQYLPKLRVALETRPPGFLVVARTDARAVVGLDEAITRACAFAEAGADAVFVEAPRSDEELRAIRARVPADVVLVANMVEGGKTPLRTVEQLADDGFRFVIHPVSGLLAAARAMEDTFVALRRDGTTATVEPTLMPFAEMNERTGLPARYAREKAWR